MLHRDRVRKTNEPCPFCTDKTEPVYTEPKRLRALMTEKGKIVSRNRSGVCMKHQRKLTTAVKRARYLALLPYVSVLH